MATKKAAEKAVEEVKAEEVKAEETKAPKADRARKVKVRLFRDSNQYKESLFVAVNGESYMIPRGVEVEVPYYIAEVIENSLKEDQKTAETLRILEENYAGK